MIIICVECLDVGRIWPSIVLSLSLIDRKMCDTNIISIYNPFGENSALPFNAHCLYYANIFDICKKQFAVVVFAAAEIQQKSSSVNNNSNNSNNDNGRKSVFQCYANRFKDLLISALG